MNSFSNEILLFEVTVVAETVVKSGKIGGKLRDKLRGMLVDKLRGKL